MAPARSSRQAASQMRSWRFRFPRQRLRQEVRASTLRHHHTGSERRARTRPLVEEQCILAEAAPAAPTSRSRSQTAKAKEEKEEWQEEVICRMNGPPYSMSREVRGSLLKRQPQPAAAKPGAIEEFQIGGAFFVSPEEAPAAQRSKSFAEISGRFPAEQRKKRCAECRKSQQGPELEFEPSKIFELVLDPEPLVPAYDQALRKLRSRLSHRPSRRLRRQAASGFASDQFLADLANEIDGLELDKLSRAFLDPCQHPVSGSRSARFRSHCTALYWPPQGVFEESAQSSEKWAPREDLETHYKPGNRLSGKWACWKKPSASSKKSQRPRTADALSLTSCNAARSSGSAFMEKASPASPPFCTSAP